MKYRSRVLSVMAVFILLLAPLAAQGGVENVEQKTRIIVDHEGNRVEIPEKVERLAILSPWPLPSIATVFAGGTDRIVGVPPAAIGAAKAGLLGEIFPSYLDISTDYLSDGMSVNQEELLALAPDAVAVLAGNEKQKQAAQDAGIPAISFSMSNWGYNPVVTYDNWVELLGEIWPDKAKSDRVSGFSHKMEQMIAGRVKDIPEDQRTRILFLFQYSDKTIVTSGKYFYGQKWCDLIGAKNVAEEVPAERLNAVINMEQIYKWNPDVIFITNFTPAVADDLYENTLDCYDWTPVKAVKEKRVYKMPLGVYRSYTPGADVPVTLLWMAKKAYPELFADWNLSEEVKDYYKQMYSITLIDEQVNRMYNQDASGASGTRSAVK